MKPIIYEGVEQSIEHLAPVKITCPCQDIERDLNIQVSFSSHCYTKAYDPECHDKEEIVVHEASDRARVFCPIRYELSHRLGGIVANLPQRKVYQTPETRNYVYAVPLDIEGQNYEVYFMLQRAEKIAKIDLRMMVESAYPVDTPSPVKSRPGKIRFPVLAYKVFARKLIKFAPR